MASAADPIYDVYWEGPIAWELHEAAPQEHHALYAIYGTHRVYGSRSLLYIGMTEQAGGKRLKEHAWWVKEESDPVVFHLGSIGEFTDWRRRDHTYARAPSTRVSKIESLLIHAHQPAYNSQELLEPSKSDPFRVFNSGHYGSLLPEVSYRYYRDP